MHRTFVKFSDEELLFLRQLQSVIRKTGGTRQASLSNVLRGVVRDYKKTLEREADPDFLATYRSVARGPRIPQL